MINVFSKDNNIYLGTFQNMIYLGAFETKLQDEGRPDADAGAGGTWTDENLQVLIKSNSKKVDWIKEDLKTFADRTVLKAGWDTQSSCEGAALKRCKGWSFEKIIQKSWK